MGSARAADWSSELERGFSAPPASSAPHTWYHWMQGNVTKEGITADLEAMKRVGIGGVQVFNVSERIPEGPAPYMSPQWMELFRHAASEADRLGLEVCFHNCAGWSSSGGPWVKPEHGMQRIVTSETNVHGAMEFKGKLPAPASRLGYYRDIAVLAFHTPKRVQRIPKLDVKALTGDAYSYGLQPDSEPVPTDAVVPRGDVIDLTSKLGATGDLAWQVPDGDWTILRIGHTPNGRVNAPAPAAGRGLEVDKLSREALDAHWRDGIAPILKALGPLAGKTVNNSLIDSYEVGCNNWTPKFRQEFIQRRGYDPIPFLVTLSGRYIESGEVTERFLWDFRRTIGDLFAENYYYYFSDLCHKNGLMASVEPYDGPFECLQVGAKADIVMGEFWVNSPEQKSIALASQVAHTHGIKIVGAESFTATPEAGKWLNHPGSLKALGDYEWAQGLNRFIFHCYALQPWMDHAPGMTMGQWGTHFGRFNTWWEQSRPWITYVKRGQYVLQQGRPVTDVLFFGGEASPNGGAHRPELKAKGYNYDAIGTDLIGELKVQNGLLTLPAGGTYKILVFPETTWMTPRLAQIARDLVGAGATILAPKPRKSPSLQNFPNADAEVSKTADEVWGNSSGEHPYKRGKVFQGKSVEEVLAATGIGPDFECLTPGAQLVFAHRTIGQADAYFVSNQKLQPVSVECSFRISGKIPELWDMETGEIQDAPIWHSDGKRTTLSLQLEQSGSILVVFRKSAQTPASQIAKVAFSPAAPAGPAPVLPRLVIRQATYGAFAGTGLVDVTVPVADAVQNGQVTLRASNELAGDPAPDIVKELRVQYECGGRTNIARVEENKTLELPLKNETGQLRILKAFYGKFHEQLKGMPALSAVDVTSRLSRLVKNETLEARADNALAGGDPAVLVAKELHVDYTVGGVPKQAVIQENEQFTLPEDSWRATPPAPRLKRVNGQWRLQAAEPGTYTLTDAKGGERIIAVPSSRAPSNITGPWQVSFQPSRGAPPEATFENLISWAQHTNTGIKYFSGTATYRKKITIAQDTLGSGRPLLLDLGQVQVIAEVKLNGKELGTLWKAPFRIDITDAARAGENDLEIRVINLWPNRLIGDEQYPLDVEWDGIALKQWPEWLVAGQPRPVKERVTFTTWRHWKKNSPLQPSGLIGPVLIRPLTETAVEH